MLSRVLDLRKRTEAGSSRNPRNSHRERSKSKSAASKRRTKQRRNRAGEALRGGPQPVSNRCKEKQENLPHRANVRIGPSGDRASSRPATAERSRRNSAKPGPVPLSSHVRITSDSSGKATHGSGNILPGFDESNRQFKSASACTRPENDIGMGPEKCPHSDWGDVEALLAESDNLESLRDTLTSMKAETREVFESLPALTRALSAMKIDTANAAGDLEERMKSLVKDYRVMQGILAKAPLGFSGRAEPFAPVTEQDRPAWMPPREEFDYEMLAAEIDDIGSKEKAVYQRMKTDRDGNEKEPSRLTRLVSQRIGQYHRDMRKHARQSLRYQRQQERFRKQEEASRKAAEGSEHYREPPLEHLAPWMDPSQALKDAQRKRKPPKPVVFPKPETPWYLECEEGVARPEYACRNVTDRQLPRKRGQAKQSQQGQRASTTLYKYDASHKEKSSKVTMISSKRCVGNNPPGQHTAARSKSRQDAKRLHAKRSPAREPSPPAPEPVAVSPALREQKLPVQHSSSTQASCSTADFTRLLDVVSCGHPRVRALDSLPSYCTDFLLLNSKEAGLNSSLIDGCVALYIIRYLQSSEALETALTEALQTMDHRTIVMKDLKSNLARFERIKGEEIIAVVCLALSALAVSASMSIMEEAISTVAPQIVDFFAAQSPYQYLVQYKGCQSETVMHMLRECVSGARDSLSIRESVRATASAFKSATGELLNPVCIAAIQTCRKSQRISEMDIASVLEELVVSSDKAACVRAVLRCTVSDRCNTQWRSSLDEMLTDVLNASSTGKVYESKALKLPASTWSCRTVSCPQVESALRRTLQQAIGLRRSKLSQVDVILQLANVAGCDLDAAQLKISVPRSPTAALRVCELSNSSGAKAVEKEDTMSPACQDHLRREYVSAESLERFVQGTVAASVMLNEQVEPEHKTTNPPVSSIGLAPAGVIQSFINRGEEVNQSAVSKVAIELVREDYKKSMTESNRIHVQEGPSDEAILEVVTSLLLQSNSEDDGLKPTSTPATETAEVAAKSCMIPVDQAVQAEVASKSESALVALEKQIGTLAGHLTKSFEQNLDNEAAVRSKTQHLVELEQHIEQRERLQRKWEETMMERLERLREESNQQITYPAQLVEPLPARVVHEQGIQAINDEPKPDCIGVETQCDILDPVDSTAEEAKSKEPQETDPAPQAVETPELRIVLDELRDVLHQQKQQAQSVEHVSNKNHEIDMANALREETQRAMVELREWSTAQLDTVMEHLERMQKETVQPEVQLADANDALPIRQQKTRLNWEESSDESSETDEHDARTATSMLSEGQIDVDPGALSDGEQVLAQTVEPNVTLVHLSDTGA